MDFSVNDVEVGTKASEVRLTGRVRVHARVKVSAYLSPVVTNTDNIPSDRGSQFWTDAFNNRNIPTDNIHDRPMDGQPYWHIERARIGNTRQVPVELVMNGKTVARKDIVADGSVQQVVFDAQVEHSSWLAVRILGSSHTNPIFILVDGKPIRTSRQSAQWCLAAVNQCWTQKAPKISRPELPDAQKAYDHAREVYAKLISECE
jgi:hypothetical protein